MDPNLHSSIRIYGVSRGTAFYFTPKTEINLRSRLVNETYLRNGLEKSVWELETRMDGMKEMLRRDGTVLTDTC